MSDFNPNEARRRASSKAQILAALEAAGPRGCTNVELNAIAFRYGGRIHELRREGYAIADPVSEGDGVYRYVLHAPDTRPKCEHCGTHYADRDGLCVFCINGGVKPAPRPGSPGYLASLPTVADPEPPQPTDRLF